MIARTLLALFLLCTGASAASLLPPGKQQFLGANGAPLAGGSVYFYVPSTTTPKDTYQNSAETILNNNPVQLDSGGFAVIYGSGAYREVVKDASGNTIYDQLTADTSATDSSWAGSSGGSANALTLSASGFSAASGQSVSWKNSFTNTGPTTATVGGGTYPIVKDTLSGPVQLTGGELTANNISTALFESSAGQFHLINDVKVTPSQTIAAAATTDLGSARSPNVLVTGSAVITSFGTGAFAAQPLYFVTFSGNATLTYNATSLLIPGNANLTTTAGSLAIVKYLGSGNWQVLAYLAGLGAGTEIINAQTGTTYTVVGADQGKLVTLSNAADITVTVPEAVGAFGRGFWFDVQNVGIGTAFLVPTAGTINGVASKILPNEYGFRVISDGANWQITGVNPIRGRVLLNRLTASSIAYLEDTTSIQAAFSTYDIEFDCLFPATTNQSLELQIYTGATLRTSSYVSHIFYSDSAGGANANPTTYVPIVVGQDNGFCASGMATIYTPSQTASYKRIFGQAVGATNGVSGPSTSIFGGYWGGGTDAVTGFRVLFASGNIVSGQVRIYGRN